jgi:hypothetical protein
VDNNDSGTEWKARKAVIEADELREANLRGYPYGADSEHRRRVDAGVAVGKFLLVILPVGALVLWTIWTVVSNL